MSRFNLGCVRLPEDRLDQVTLLRKIYEFESERLSGPGSSRRDMNEVLWTKENLMEGIDLTEEELGELTDLLEYLEDANQMMVVEKENHNEYITRVCETIRLLGHTYRYWPPPSPSIEAIRWRIEDKEIPKRGIPADDFLEDLKREVKKRAEDKYLDDLLGVIDSVVGGVTGYLSDKMDRPIEEIKYSDFQFEAAKRGILGEFGREQEENQMMCADVGGGKTIAFAIPAFVSALYNSKAEREERDLQLLLYPRTALSQDQFNTLNEIENHINTPVSFEVFYEHHTNHRTVKRGVKNKYEEDKEPPKIIVTTLETLKRRLQRREFSAVISKRLRRVVIDEIHLINGMTGMNTVKLLDRLRALVQEEIYWTGSSATVAAPLSHASTIFAKEKENIDSLIPSSEDLEEVGLAHHVFLRRKEGRNSVGTLVNLTSLLIHNRRDRLSKRSVSGDDDIHQKTVAFGDSLDLLGRWNADFRENERTEVGQYRYHPLWRDLGNWSERQRELPYAHRFLKPLQARINLDLQNAPDGYENIFQEYQPTDICDRCKNGERVELGRFDRDQMEKLGNLVYRHPNTDEDSLEEFSISEHPAFDSGAKSVGSLDLCPFLQAGACLWFSEEEKDIERLTNTPDNFGMDYYYEWKDVARSRIYSSQTKNLVEGGIGDDLSKEVFRAPIKEVYDVGDDEKVLLDLVFASPSLEVGIDLDDVTETILYKAIRNVSSYRQKVGRAGREIGSDTLNISLMSERPIDLHYYRQPRKLIRYDNLDPIPLKDFNPSVQLQGLYMGVWDYLANERVLPEAIPLDEVSMQDGGDEYRFTLLLEGCLEVLKRDENELRTHLSTTSRKEIQRDSRYIDDAIEQVREQIQLLLSDTSELLDGDKKDRLSDILVEEIKGNSLRLKSSVSSKIRKLENHEENCEESLKEIDPIQLNISDEFTQLKKMSNTLWDKDKIDSVLKELEDRSYDPDLDQMKTSLKGIKHLLKEIKDEDVEPAAVSLYLQFKDFYEENNQKAHYLSYIFEDVPGLEAVQRNKDFTRLGNLFTNPYERKVELNVHDREGNDEYDKTISLKEALYRTLPGTWTYYLGKEPSKTLCGHLNSDTQNRILEASYDRLEGDFKMIDTDILLPPDTPGEELDIYRPTRLELQKTDKRIPFSHETLKIADGDEEDEERDDIRPVNIPKSYSNDWIEIKSQKSVPIQVNDALEDKISVGDTGSDWKEEINHPLMDGGLISSIDWHEDLNVIEYQYSIDRIYSGDIDPVELRYSTDIRQIGLGRSIDSEGISIKLEEENFKETVDDILEGIENGEKRWRPTAIKAFQALLMNHNFEDEGDTDRSISFFQSQDLIEFMLFSIYDDYENVLKSLKERLERYQEQEGLLEEDIEQYMTNLSDPLSEEDISSLEEDILMISSEFEDMMETLRNWVRITLLNTFAIKSLHSAQALAGVTGDEISYGLDLQEIKEEETYRVYLYDKTEGGNGSSKIIKDYLHILTLQREVSEELLPTEDFLSILEENLLQCPQYHTDINALTMFEDEGISGFEYVDKESREVKQVSQETWQSLGIGGAEEVWKLPLINNITQPLSEMLSLEKDDLDRATNICFTGCPECVLDKENILGTKKETYIDKSILDYWFHKGSQDIKEYKRPIPKDIVEGSSDLRIGNLSELYLDMEERRIRAVTLPYTIGFELSRDDLYTEVLIREDDIAGHKHFPNQMESTHGIDSVGFRRLIWFELLTTAYLEALDEMPDDRKEIKLIFYDCRDIRMDDPYLSDRMIESIEPHRPSAERLRTLSDVLAWLSRSGFDIKLLIDEERRQEEGVNELVERLLEKCDLDVFSKDLSGEEGFGSMHAKALKTPIGILQGSANMTLSGTKGNEEIISHHMYGSDGYEELSMRIEDLFYGAEKEVNR